MHQQSRHPPRMYSPASSPQTNPARTNNPRERASSAGPDAPPVHEEVAESPGAVGPGPSKESVKKLDQIVQNFFAKAAVLILQSRLNTTPVGWKREDGRKPNQWFSIETDEIEDFRDELRVYRLSGSLTNRPPPMIIETYIDASRLSSSQSLVVVDGNGKRWDVLEALNLSESSGDSPRKAHAQKRNTEVILERWRFELKCLSDDTADRVDFGPVLPTVYKRAIVFFRSLFVTTRIMPCWKYSQQALAKGIHPALEVKCRVLTAEPEYTGYDPLRQPLHDSRDPVTEYVFSDLEVPVGCFYSSVTYRNDCSFRVDDAESLLSSRFMGIDENYFKPSMPPRRELGRSDSHAEPGSLPSQRHGRGSQEPQQTYGSLSTFHGEGALGTSPITALRSVRPIGSDSSSPSASPSASIEQPDPPHSLPIRGAAARPTVRTLDVAGRRPSLSFQPFKAGSLSGSPKVPETEAPSSPQSLTRPGLAGPSRAGNRSSLIIGMAASLRGPSAPQEIPSVTGSLRPTSRYSSSFSHRRGRPSFGGQSKADDDQASSGKQSLSSSAQPGSGLLTEAGGVASSGSFATDDDNISEFLKALESRRTLKSFEPNTKGESLASKRTAAQLSKFHLMRESNNVLTESMTSSMHLQRSSTSSSRQLTNVPGMVNPASMSISSSPGKPLSPHTPHTPAIPSRLSENSIIDYQAQDQGAPARGQGRSNNNGVVPTGEEEEPVEEEDDGETPMTTQQDGIGRTAAAGAATTTSTGTTAIDIPLSPRLLHNQHRHHHHQPHHDSSAANRRASSVAHPQHRHRSIASDADAYQRSASVEDASGSGTREVPSLSTLLAYQRHQHQEQHQQQRAGSVADPAAAADAAADGLQSTESASAPSVDAVEGPTTTGAAAPTAAGSGSGDGSGASGPPPRPGSGGSFRGVRYPVRGGARPGSFSSTATGAGAGGAGGALVGGKYAGSVEGTDEEPLLFPMSEFERELRRSLEEERRGGSGSGSGSRSRSVSVGVGVGEATRRAGGVARGGGVEDGDDDHFEPRGIQRKGW